MKRRLFATITCLVAVALCSAGAEIVAIAYLYVREGRYVSARDGFASTTNMFIQDLVGDGADCSYLDTLFPHPYLAFVHHGNQPCGLGAINNVGLFGPDFPSRRREDRFVVLLTGGSVAAQLGFPVSGGRSYLETFLNEHYASPNGKPFLLLNGADGAWKQPQQTVLLLLYADAVDAVVTLDGFNEHYLIQSALRFEYPANNFHTVNPLVAGEFDDVVVRWMVGRMRAFAAEHTILSRSHAAYAVVSAAEAVTKRRMDARPKSVTSVESIFSLPIGWTAEERQAWQIAQYQKYIRAMDLIARDHGLLAAHFIQPTPAIDKPLTVVEQRVVGDLGYRDVYRRMAADLLTLNASGSTVLSLLDVFRGDARTLYADPIHLVREWPARCAAKPWTCWREGGRSPGYERMAHRMATQLGEVWKLSRRDSSARIRRAPVNSDVACTVCGVDSQAHGSSVKPRSMP